MESTRLNVEDGRVRACTDSAGAGTVAVVGLDTRNFHRIKAGRSERLPKGLTPRLTASHIYYRRSGMQAYDSKRVARISVLAKNGRPEYYSGRTAGASAGKIGQIGLTFLCWVVEISRWRSRAHEPMPQLVCVVEFASSLSFAENFYSRR